MNNLKLLIVEGNTKKENLSFKEAGCIPQSKNFEEQIKSLAPDCEIDIVEPGDESGVNKIIDKLNKYNGVVLTGSTLRINEESEEVKKHIEFAKKCFEKEKKIFAACWGLQVTVIAAGGKCRTAPKGPHVGIAQNIEINENGKKNKLYASKPEKFTTPAFNYDEVITPPKNSVLLASDAINKYQALYFKVGKSEIWGLQYHPEIPYDYMVKLIKHRSKNLIEKKVFKDSSEVLKHIELIQKENSKLKDGIRLAELKNWLEFI